MRNEDLNLNASLFVIYGVGNTSVVLETGLALLHSFGDRIPTLSVQRFNVVTDTNAVIVVETVRIFVMRQFLAISHHKTSV